MIHSEITGTSEVYIKRSDAHKIKIRDLADGCEYYPCEENEGECIVIKGPKYSITKNENKIEICVLEDISPNYWDKEYSADLWFKCYAKAVDNHKKSIKIFKDVDPHQLMSLLFYFDFDITNYRSLNEIIVEADRVLAEIEADTEYLVRRSLIKLLNK